MPLKVELKTYLGKSKYTFYFTVIDICFSSIPYTHVFFSNFEAKIILKFCSSVKRRNLVWKSKEYI